MYVVCKILQGTAKLLSKMTTIAFPVFAKVLKQVLNVAILSETVISLLESILAVWIKSVKMFILFDLEIPLQTMSL